MCRIAGIIAPDVPLQKVQGMVKTMCDTLRHGGPDDEGIYCNTAFSLVFGHRRLSVIDLSKNGHQPMADADGRAFITFNGEIYNYRELKNELIQLNAVFYSDTDTEVIIQAYLQWGTAAFAKLKGMFAFALLDVNSGSVYLVRDSMGIKPLYYSNLHNQFIFSSEIRAFRAAGVNNAEERWPVWLLAYGSIPEPYTTLKEVKALPKGHYLHRKKNGSCTIIRYISEPVQLQIAGETEALSYIKELLHNSVKRQLIADAPIGVFLSGGIDSSLLTLLAHQEHGQYLKTISIFFDDKQYDESAYQNAISKQLTGESFSHLVKQQDFETHLPQIMRAMDMPTTDGINSWFISKYAHDAGLKAVLSGLGADELFGGYPSFRKISYLKYLKKLPAYVFKAANLFKTDKYQKLAYLGYDHPAAEYLFLRGAFTPALIAKILNTDESYIVNILFGDDLPVHRSYNKTHAAWLENNIYMQNQLLRDTDVMSMSHGLEVRVPYLDEDLQQYVERIHPDIRFNNHQPKKILTDSFKNLLPEAVWNRPKMGFTFPLQQWMKNNGAISSEQFYKGKTAQGIIKKFNQGGVHWSRAYALYQIQGHV